jgi:hypothetical protein
MANTSSPLSEVAIANMAATTLDDRRIASLDDDTSLARFVASEFGYVRDELLRLHPWTFAKARATLAPAGSVDYDLSTLFGWSYAYRLPDDCLRLFPLRCRGAWNAPLVPHEREGRFILTNEPPPLKINYIKRVTVAPFFDPLFARALGARLAVLASQRITGKASYFDKATLAYRQAIEEAYLSNGLDSGTPESQFRDSIHDVRGTGL